MKLNEAKPHFESSGDMQEHFFSIQDQGMIFDILRSKMYSNPILAICREITSNARDAHREIGKPELPIQIHLPIGLEPEYRVKDFGPGISPDRMVNIFIKYTASTKRDDNTQTGGFGLGAKTPFSYSDTFMVTTVVDKIKYSYACSIDDTKVGKLILLHKQPCKEPNSTEVTIPVKPIDFQFFRQWTEQACRHWTTRPIITGSPIEWTKFTNVIDGKNWSIINDESNRYNYNHSAKLIIDGIEYPLELEALRKYADPKLIDAARGTFVMYFGVGELSLSANREQIFLDKPTQNKVKSRLDEITKEIKDRVDQKIDAFPNLWDANIYYRKELTQAFNNLHFLGTLAWKGSPLTSGYVDTLCGVYSFEKGRYAHRKKNPDPDKLQRSISKELSFDENSQLYINDLAIKEPTPRHVKKAFDDDPTLTSVQVICPSSLQSEEDLNKKINLDKMAPKKLSSITKATARNYTTSTSRLLIFKFDMVADGFRQVSYDSMQEDDNNKVICFLNEIAYPNTIRVPVLSNNKNMRSDAIRSLLERNPKNSLYGVHKDTDKDRVEEEFASFKTLDSFIEEKVLNNKLNNFVEIKFAHTHIFDVDERTMKSINKLEPLILKKSSPFLNRLYLHKKIKKLGEQDKSILDIYESVKGEITDKELKKFVKDNPDWDVETINNECSKKYPLLNAISTYSFSNIIEDVASYVNMSDKI